MKLAELRSISQRVRQVAGNSTYNYPDQWYMKVDKTIVKLSGGPRDRVRYESKGYLWLDPEAVEEWLGSPEKGIESERVKVVANEWKKARLIEQIRLIGEMHTKARIKVNFSRLNIEQLEKIVETLRKEYGDIVDIWDEKALGLPTDFADELIAQEQEMMRNGTVEANPRSLAEALSKSKREHRPLMGGDTQEDI